MKKSVLTLIFITALVLSISFAAAAECGFFCQIGKFFKSIFTGKAKAITGMIISKTEPGLVGLWHFDEGIGTIAGDSVGVNHGTLLSALGMGSDPGWVAGMSRYRQAISFDGADDTVEIPDSSAVDLPSYWTLEAWIYPDAVTGTFAIISKYSDASPGYQFGVYNSQLFCQFTSGVSWPENQLIAGTVSAGTWTHVACTYDNNELKIFVNGALANSLLVGAKIPADSAAPLRISGDAQNHAFFDGMIDEVGIFDRALSASEIAAHAAAAPISRWHFDEGTGTTAGDSVDANNGTIIDDEGDQWVDSMPGFDKALSFDGTNDYVRVADSANLDITETITISAWVKTNKIGVGGIVGKWSDTSNAAQSYLLALDSSGKAACLVNDAIGSWDNLLIGNTLINDNNWHFVACTVDKYGGAGSNNQKLYVDGILDNQATTSADIIRITTTDLIIGTTDVASAANYFSGTIDEVSVYDRVLSASEIADHAAVPPAPAVCGNGIIEAGEQCDDGNAADGDCCSSTCQLETGVPSGIVSYWKLDTGSGTTAYDSIDANPGTIMNNPTPTWTAGKVGNALIFDAVDDMINVPDSVNLDLDDDNKFTVEAWVKTNGASGDHQVIAGRLYNGEVAQSSYWIELTPGLVPDVGVTGTSTNICYSTEAVTAGVWHHIVGTYDGSTLKIYVDNVLKNSCPHTAGMVASDAPLTIGRWTHSVDKNPFNGAIDEVAVYNRALDATEIEQHYNNGGLGEDYCYAAPVVCTDADNDTYAIEGGACGPIDCNDANPAINPGATEVCDNIIDDDCDGLIDCDDPDCTGDPACPAPPCPANMISYWTFDDSANPGNDDFNANDGTLINGPIWTSGGQIGGAIDFDGTDDYVDVPDSASLDAIASALTIEMWVKPDKVSGEQMLVAKGGGWGRAGFFTTLGVSTGTWRFGIGTSPGEMVLDNGGTLEVGQWYHLAATYDGTTMRQYIDGVLQPNTATTTNPNLVSDYPARMGGSDGTYLLPYDGTIDEVAVYDRALTLSEVEEHYNNGMAGFGYCVPVECTDADNDTYAIEGGACGPIDCNDADPNIYPGAPEICNNIDDDCDTLIDEALTQYCYTGPAGTDGVGICHGGTQTCTAGVWGSCVGEVLPQFEGDQVTCWDSLDNDCDGLADQDDDLCVIGVVELPACTVIQMLDLNGDYSVDINDAIHILRYITGLAESLGIGKGCEAQTVIAG